MARPPLKPHHLLRLLLVSLSLAAFGRAIEVDMKCDANTMTAIVKVGPNFTGRLFTLTHPYECYNIGEGKGDTIALSVPLHGRQCGTRNLGNGTFTNSLVVQHHPLVLRNTDRRIDIACDYHQLKRRLRGGKQVAEGDTLTMTQVITGLAPTPPVRLRVVNSTGEEVRGVELGDPLYLKVEMLDESVFGIFGSELVARSGEGSESVVLIDDHGCPVEPNVFPALNRDQKTGSKSLFAPFQAFRFASDDAVKFQMTVSFCLDSCLPVSCENSTEEMGTTIAPEKGRNSFGRRRRRRSVGATEVFVGASDDEDPSDDLRAGDVVTDVTMETSLFVVNNLKPLGSPNEDNKLTERRDNWMAGFPENSSSEAYGVHVNSLGICFSPWIVFGAATIGCVSQMSIFILCFWILVSGRKGRGGGGGGDGSSSYKDSSRASISSKTGLYDSRT